MDAMGSIGWIAAIAALVLLVIVGIFFKSRFSPSQKKQSGTKKDDNAKVADEAGMTLMGYAARLNRRREEIRVHVRKVRKKQIKLLRLEHDAITEKIKNLESSFISHQKLYKETKETLEILKGNHLVVKIEEAQAALEQGNSTLAEALLEATAQDDKGNAAIAAFRRGQLAEDMANFSKAMEYFEYAVDYDKEKTPLYLLAAGYTADKLGLYEYALHWYETLIHIREENDPNTPEHALAINNLASLYKHRGHPEEAEPLYRKALEIEEKNYGENHPSLATSLNNLALLYVAQQRYAEAKALYKRAIAILEEHFPHGHPHLDAARKNYQEMKLSKMLADAKVDLNSPEKAVGQFAEVIFRGRLDEEDTKELK